jgi:hypothetical protein
MIGIRAIPLFMFERVSLDLMSYHQKIEVPLIMPNNPTPLTPK